MNPTTPHADRAQDRLRDAISTLREHGHLESDLDRAAWLRAARCQIEAALSEIDCIELMEERRRADTADR